MTELKQDRDCTPFPGKVLYRAVTLPYLILLVVTAPYLWQRSAVVSLIYICLHRIAFLVTVCPRCAMRFDCPAALKRRAKRYDALVVLECEAAVQTVRDSVGPNSSKVLQGVETEGIMSVRPRLSWPCNLSLELEGVSRYEYLGTQ